MRKRGIIATSAAALGLAGALFGISPKENPVRTTPAINHQIALPEGYVPLASLSKHKREPKEAPPKHYTPTQSTTVDYDSPNAWFEHLETQVATADTKGLRTIVDYVRKQRSSLSQLQMDSIGLKLSTRYGELIMLSRDIPQLVREWDQYGEEVFYYSEGQHVVAPIIDGIKTRFGDIALSYEKFNDPESLPTAYETMMKAAVSRVDSITDLARFDPNALVQTIARKHPGTMNQGFSDQVLAFAEQFNNSTSTGSDYSTIYNESTPAMAYCATLSTPLAIVESLTRITPINPDYDLMSTVQKACNDLRDASMPSM